MEADNNKQRERNMGVIVVVGAGSEDAIRHSHPDASDRQRQVALSPVRHVQPIGYTVLG